MIKVAEFAHPRQFRALSMAQEWLEEMGISYGSSQRPCPIGLLIGDFNISKWHNMTAAEQSQLDGTITGNMLTGPLAINLTESAATRLGLPPI